MNYSDFIQSIIDTRGRFCVEGYKEKHHIIPKCLGGTDDEINLIDLTASEHFTAHKLLAEENPDNDKLILAWSMMAFPKNCQQQRKEINANEYEDLRKRLGKTTSKIVKQWQKNHPGYSYSKLREWQLSHPEEYSKAQSRNLKGEKNGMYGKGYLLKCRKFTEEHKQHIKESMPDMRGEKNPFFGKKHSDKTKYAISVAKGHKVYVYDSNLKLLCMFNSKSDAAETLHIRRNKISERYDNVNDVYWCKQLNMNVIFLSKEVN